MSSTLLPAKLPLLVVANNVLLPGATMYLQVTDPSGLVCYN